MTMQLVQTTRDALLKPLSTVAGIVERRHTLPILANILMRKEGNKVAFIATDLEKTKMKNQKQNKDQEI